MGALYDATRSILNLYQAWITVRSNAAHSTDPQVGRAIQEIDGNPLRALRRIQHQLKDCKFKFEPQRGYLKRKRGKSSFRPIVVAPVQNRIVQRAVLNILQSTDPAILPHLGKIPAVLRTPTSVGGVPDRGVHSGIEAVCAAIRSGARSYIRSDIKEFFTRIPKTRICEFVAEATKDAEFTTLFTGALSTELANPDELASAVVLFPLHDLGVPQGSSLSTFAGNVLLRQFDRELNGRGVTTVRYIDDFIILGPTDRSVRLAFVRGRTILRSFEMDAYDPSPTSTKARQGRIDDGLEFLGCRIRPHGITPSKDSMAKLLDSVRFTISKAKRSIANLIQDGARRRAEDAYAQTLVLLDKKIRGWGDAFQFCDVRLPFVALDARLDDLINGFHSWFERRTETLDSAVRRRTFGITVLRDIPTTRPETITLPPIRAMPPHVPSDRH